MAGFNSIAEVVDAELAGRGYNYFFNKQVGFVSAPYAENFYDWGTVGTGSPKEMIYTGDPLTSVVLRQSTHKGMPHGPNVTPYKKFIRRITTVSALSTGISYVVYNFCDYLMYYPFVPSDIHSTQNFINNFTLSRYTSGEGVQIMPICTNSGGVASGTFYTCTYTNSQGVGGRVTPLMEQSLACSAAQFRAGVVSTRTWSNYPTGGVATGTFFLPLQDGDTGVRSIESVTFSGLYDTCLHCFILIKPLCAVSIGADPPNVVEKDFLINNSILMPEIVDDAFLSAVIWTYNGISSRSVFGSIETVYG